jgi:hypothetical protein
MLTVKYVQEGAESVVSAESVVFFDRGLDEVHQITHGRFVRASGTPRGVAGETFRDFFAEGHVYVMNDNGKTVGSYDVSDSWRETIRAQA